jgi:hypothetical protein
LKKNNIFYDKRKSEGDSTTLSKKETIQSSSIIYTPEMELTPIVGRPKMNDIKINGMVSHMTLRLGLKSKRSIDRDEIERVAFLYSKHNRSRLKKAGET